MGLTRGRFNKWGELALARRPIETGILNELLNIAIHCALRTRVRVYTQGITTRWVFGPSQYTFSFRFGRLDPGVKNRWYAGCDLSFR